YPDRQHCLESRAPLRNKEANPKARRSRENEMEPPLTSRSCPERGHRARNRCRECDPGPDRSVTSNASGAVHERSFPLQPGKSCLTNTSQWPISARAALPIWEIRDLSLKPCLTSLYFGCWNSATRARAVGGPADQARPARQRPRVRSCRFPEGSYSANNSTLTVMEVFPTAITPRTNSTSCPWTGV